MTTAEEIRDLERQRLRSLVSGDMRTAQTLHADDYQLVSPNGETWSKQEYLEAITTGQLDYEVFEPISQIAVRLSPDSALIRYQVRIKFRGRRESISCWHTDSYELHDGRWRAVWSQATAIQAQ